jgi:hypothetical protein
MDNLLKIILFYSFDSEIDIKDVETELFTEERNKVNFCFFHNKELHFSKSEILKRTLIKQFENILPRFKYSKRNMIMTKIKPNFDTVKFDNIVTAEYEDYTKKINYRIDCIFQTIIMFVNLYKSNNLIFVLPQQLENSFNNFLQEYELEINEIQNVSQTLIKWDIINWINYYLKKDTQISNDKFSSLNVKKILEIKN